MKPAHVDKPTRLHRACRTIHHKCAIALRHHFVEGRPRSRLPAVSRTHEEERRFRPVATHRGDGIEDSAKACRPCKTPILDRSIRKHTTRIEEHLQKFSYQASIGFEWLRSSTGDTKEPNRGGDWRRSARRQECFALTRCPSRESGLYLRSILRTKPRNCRRNVPFVSSRNASRTPQLIDHVPQR